MARSRGAEKLVVWRQRLAKFGRSGLSVTDFCQQEGLAQSQFYYWSRRIREKTAQAEPEPPSIHERQALTVESTVEVFIGADVKVRLPGTDRELVKFVLHGLQFDAITNARPSAFERIDFGNDWAARR